MILPFLYESVNSDTKPSSFNNTTRFLHKASSRAAVAPKAWAIQKFEILATENGVISFLCVPLPILKTYLSPELFLLLKNYIF